MKNINKYLKCGIVLGVLVYSVGTSIPIQSTYADEINTETVVKEWKPEGKVIATGEDGVPWELYENGYLLFKPEPGKNKLLPKIDNDLNLNWRKHSIKAIGFTGEVFLPEDSHGLFRGAGSLEDSLLSEVEYIDASKLNTSQVTNMSETFFGLRNLKKLDVSKWDTSKVTNMAGMFAHTAQTSEYKRDDIDPDATDSYLYKVQYPDIESPLKLDLSKWDTSKVKSMEGMFSFFYGTKLDLSNWNTNSVESTHNMFFRSQTYNVGDLSKWNTSKLKDMSGMFQESDIIELNINDWDVSNVENMAGLFMLDYNLTKLDLSKWDTSNVKNMSDIFSETRNLKYLDITNWDTTNVEKIFDDNMFFGNLSLTHLKLGNKFANTKLNTELFNYLNMHRYGDKYGDKWTKEDNSTKYYTVEEWNKEYRANPNNLSGMWVRERNFDYYTLKFETGTDESIEPLEVEDGKDFELPVPVKVKEGYHFVGWSKTQDGEVIKDKNNLSKNKEVVTLYAKWEKNPPVSTNTPIDENDNLILPPVVDELPEYNGGVNPADAPINEKPEYKGTLSTNTPVDDKGELVLPPVVDELPEYKTPSLEIPDLVISKEKIKSETVKEENKKERELPNTNSTSILTTLISSVIGTLGLGYKSKRRK